MEQGRRRFLLDVTARQRAQDHRLLLHADLAHRLPARHRARPGPRRRAEARRESQRPPLREDPAAAVADELLKVTVCDPACGSGHFLVAAARRIAKRLAAVREHNPEPTLEALRTALRDVVTHCIYGVDINPMAVELAKVSLWLEALEPGKPLGFLDARIKCGNALIGATPTLIAGGIPDEAFKPVEGDDPQWAASLRRANAKDNSQQDELFTDEAIFSQSNEKLAAQLDPDRHAHQTLPCTDVHRQAAAYRDVGRIPRVPPRTADRRRLVRRLHLDQDKEAPPAIVNRVFRALREQGALAHSPGDEHRDRAAPRRVRFLPLAPGVSRHLPRARRRRPGRRCGHRLGRRLHLRPRQPAVGQGRFRGQEVLQRR